MYNKILFDERKVVRPDTRRCDVTLVQALLRVGQSILSKRKRDFEENTFLKEKVARVQQEEEERIRATVANQAARDALGKLVFFLFFQHWTNFPSSLENSSLTRLGVCRGRKVFEVVRHG